MTKINIIYCCKDCGDKISYNTAFYGKGYCNACKGKGGRHPRLGIHLKKSTKLKISNTLIGKISGKNSPRYIDGRSFKTRRCLDCKKPIKRYNALRCKSCSHIGKLNSAYKHGQGRLPYTLEFNNTLKCKIRSRDNHTCQVCALSEKQHYRNTKNIKLCIHHIDYNKQNCKEMNLISVCSSCHTKTNFNRDYWFAYFNYKLGITT